MGCLPFMQPKSVQTSVISKIPTNSKHSYEEQYIFNSYQVCTWDFALYTAPSIDNLLRARVVDENETNLY